MWNNSTLKGKDKEHHLPKTTALQTIQVIVNHELFGSSFAEITYKSTKSTKKVTLLITVS